MLLHCALLIRGPHPGTGRHQADSTLPSQNVSGVPETHTLEWEWQREAQHMIFRWLVEPPRCLLGMLAMARQVLRVASITVPPGAPPGHSLMWYGLAETRIACWSQTCMARRRP